jgi:DNA-binding beta-propeller fold protein YncE
MAFNTRARAPGAAVLFALCLGLQSHQADAREFYRLESALTLKSPHEPDWDYLAFDAGRSYLFISRRDDGILVYDVNAKKPVTTLEQSEGGNATALVPELDRGYVIKEDGTGLAFTLSTLKPIEKLKFGASADNGFYDPVTKQLLITMGDEKQAAFVDARTGKVVGTLPIDSGKLEASAPDGKGNFFMALRDRNKVIRIDARARKVTDEWTPQGCELPTGLAYDASAQRLFVSCRGNKPVLAVLDPASGKVVASPTIGRGSDAVIFDSQAHRIYSSNGFDGTLVVIDQVDANTYKLSEAITTRPYARTMALDPKTKKVYLVTAEGAVDPSQPWNKNVSDFYPNVFFKDTFTLLTYSRQNP